VWNIGRFMVLVAALAGTFGIFFLASMRVTTRAREVQVPDLQGKSVPEAQAILSDLGLVLRIEQPRRPDRTIPEDHVLSQEPEPGFVLRRQRPVRVRISDGLREPVLPTVANLPEQTAEVTLTAGQIAVGYRAEIRSAAYRLGVIVAQDPAAGQRADKVNLLVNRGEASVSYVAPDLIGSLGVRAAEVLRAQGFRVAVTAEVPYAGLPPGVVLRQTPQPGFRIQQNETITLEVSR
jgi:serine/threonine-protein kinase